MQVGDMRQFLENQQGKVRKRKEEEKRIKKGVYQMQVMIDGQNMETFDKEQKKSKERVQQSEEVQKESESQNRERKKTDVKTEMEKMLSAVGKNLNFASGGNAQV